MQNIYKDVAARLDLPEKSVEAVALLLDDGATVPFISRYRKEKTGSLDEVAIRAIESTLKSVEELYNRRDFVRKAIADAGCLDSMLGNRLDNARSITEIEDIYAPFKPKKRTRGTMARDKGLEPLAKMIMAAHSHDCHILASRFVGKKGVSDPEEALSGASDIIAEWASENAKLRNMTRNVYQKHRVWYALRLKTKIRNWPHRLSHNMPISLRNPAGSHLINISRCAAPNMKVF